MDNAKDDLKSMPMAEVEKKLGSSEDGLSQAEAEKRLAQYGPNEIAEKKKQSVSEIPLLFLGPDTLDDRSGSDPLGSCTALA
jgi:H+-transporting ATPase